MKKVLFPYYKIIRYVWNVFFVTAMLCELSYASMEFYYPQNDNTLPVESVMMAFCLVVFFVGVAEVMHEAIIKEYRSKWLTNPWSLFLIPALLIGLVMSISLFQNPDQYSAWLWIDLFVVPISTIFYLISWQLFTWLFVLKIVSENPFVKLEDGACIVKALIGMNERSLGEFEAIFSLVSSQCLKQYLMYFGRTFRTLKFHLLRHL